MKVTRSARKTLRSGARWKKGQSSSSNPRCVRFREAAATKRGAVGEAQGGGSAGITAKQLRRHELLMERKRQRLEDVEEEADAQGDMDEDENDFDGQSDATWATNFTGCTNQCFGQVVANWSVRQGSERRRLALAVLAAVSEIIRQRGGSESNEEYLQALVTALASVDSELRQPAAYLLSVLLRRTQAQSVAAAYPAIARVCQQLLSELPAGGEGEEASDDPDGLAKSLLLCLGRCLGCLQRSHWHSASTRQCLHSLLLFSLSQRPRIRKAALLAAGEAVGACSGSFRAPAAQLVAFASERLRQGAAASASSSSSSNSAAHASLRLLAATCHAFAEKQARTSVECCLNQLPLSDAKLYRQVASTLCSLLWSWPNAGHSAELAGQTLTALYDARPSPDDAGSCAAWLEVMRAGVTALAGIATAADAAGDDDEDGEAAKARAQQAAVLFHSHLTKLFTVAFNSLPDTRKEALDSVYATCHHLMTDSLPAVMRQQQQQFPNGAAHLLQVIRAGLSFQFRPAWQQVTQLLGAYFRCHGSDTNGAEVVSACLQQLADLRDSSDDKEASAWLNQALIAGLESLGPRRLLAAAPLRIDLRQGPDSWRRAWLLTLLRSHVQGAELELFVSELLPVAEAAAGAAGAAGDPVLAKQIQLLELQIWDTLPAFCTKATDTSTALPKLAKRIGQLLQVRPELRQPLLTALRRLVTSVAELPDNSPDRQAVSCYAKNYMPRLFSIYCNPAEAKPLRLPALETVRAYAAVSPKPLLLELLGKLKLATTDSAGAAAAADLIIAIASHAPAEAADQLLALCRSWCSQEDGKLQKKGYRLLQQLLHCQQRPEAVADAAPQLLLDSQPTVLPSSRKSRLRCLVLLLAAGWLEPDRKRGLAEWALPEAVLATGEQNCKAREAADTLVFEVFKFFASQQSEDNTDPAEQFLNIIFASSAGSEQCCLAGLQAVTGLLPHIRLLVTQRMLHLLLLRLRETMQDGSSTRLIVKACVRCLLTVTRRLGHVYSLDQLAECLAAVPEQYRLAFRATVRLVLTKLYATFPYETLRRCVPEYCYKMLSNVRKRSEHRQRRKESGQTVSEAASVASAATRALKGIDELLASSDEDDDDEEEEAKSTRSGTTAGRRRRKAAAAAGSAWLEEAAGTVLDLADPSAAAKIHRGVPSQLLAKPKAKDRASDFRTAPDGRMIIQDEEGESAEAQGEAAADSDDYEDVEEEEEEELERSGDKAAKLPRYQPGGRGIHRPLGSGGAAAASATSGVDKRKQKLLRLQLKKAQKASQSGQGLEPYKFVGLDRRLLSKRNRVGQRQQLVQYRKLVRRRK